MFKKPVFWIGFSLISVICTVFVFKFFPHAFPMLDLELTMDRESAIQKAAELNDRFNLSPEGYKDAAFFLSDGMTMIYVQLEGGGIDSCRKMMADTLYSLYYWRVRHFKENEIKEASYLFSPTGEVIGFYQKIPEDDPGAALSSDSALTIAERSCKDWNVDLAQWELVESSEEIRPSDRIDHSFVYERPGIKVGEAPYRLDLTVRGDMLTEVDYSVKVPEAFKRRYQEMRSANELIADFASGAMLILYIIGGIGVGLFFIMRDRWLIWKRPLFWAVFVTSLSMLGQLNYLPLSWNWYDTAVSAGGFITEQIVSAILGSILMGVVLWLTFMAAESLSRRAFPNHPQLWRLWSKKNSASKEVLALTAGGYGLIAVDIAFVLAFYFFTDKVLGWWSPVGSMVDPNILGTFYPWLSSVGMALQAGFWEECLFRAIPIAGAALIGQKYGKRNLFIILAVFIQALIFGAGHANYAQQPAYARVIELFLPSIFYAWVFIRFGLFPGIILHFAYDAVLMSLPLFIQSSEGIWFDRSMVIILTAVPILLILVRRVSVGKWTSIAAEHFNKAWIPASKKVQDVVVEEVKIVAAISSKSRKLLIVGGIAGLVLFFGLHNWDNYASMLSMNKSEAITLAEKELESRGIVLGNDWKRLANGNPGSSESRDFVWQTGDKNDLRSLIEKNYLSSPAWRVRFSRFDDSIAVDERAEEYTVQVGQDKNAISFKHSLPEARTGASLTEDEARIIAHEVLKDGFHRNPEEFKEAMAEEDKKPDRRDWRFEFSDTLNYPLEKGEARISVNINGDEASGYGKYVKTSEEWQREQRDKRKIVGIVRSTCQTVEMLVRIGAVIIAVVVWSRRKFPVKIFLIFLTTLGTLKFITFFNNLPLEISWFRTSEPFSSQFTQLFISDLLRELIGAFGNAMIAALAFRWIIGENTEQESDSGKSLLWIGFGTGALWAGFQSIIILLEPSLSPEWTTLGLYHSASALPFLGSAVMFESFIKETIFLLFIFSALHYLTKGWQQRKMIMGLAFILMFLCVNVAQTYTTIGYWLVYGISLPVILLMIYVWILRSNMAIIPVVLSVPFLLNRITTMIEYPHPVGIQIGVLTFILIIWFAIYWMKMLRRNSSG